MEHNTRKLESLNFLSYHTGIILISLGDLTYSDTSLDDICSIGPLVINQPYANFYLDKRFCNNIIPLSNMNLRSRYYDVTGEGKVQYYKTKIQNKLYMMLEKESQMTFTTGIIKNLITTAEEKLVEYSIESIKKKFGKEWYFSSQREETIAGEIINKFLPKYDSNINKYYQRLSSGQYSLMNTQFVIRIEKDTFMYVATGSCIPHIGEKLFMDSGVSATDLYIYIFGKHMVRHSKRLDKFIRRLYINNELGIYTITSGIREEGSNREGIDVVYQKMQLRDMSTLFYSHNEKEIICKHIDKFNTNEDFYKDRQILYKTGILLYGKPGTGKSSFVKTIATKYDRSIANVSISSFPTLDINALTQSINIDESRKYIILLEDIDTLFLNRDNGDSNREDMAIINKLLQFLDSNTSPTNVIFIATTNHIERLDEALLREGRFDLKVNVQGLDEETAFTFCKSFGISQSDTKDIIDGIIKDSDNEDITINQSKLQAHVLAKIENKSVEKSEEIHSEVVN